MKKLYLLLLLFGAPIHAMDDLRIVPFDRAIYGNAVHDLLATKVIALDLKDPATKIQVLIKPIRQTRSKRLCKILGAVAYQTKQYRQMTETCICALAIARQHQRKGYGTMLMQHIESISTKKDHHISLISLQKSVPFYQKLGYQGSWIDMKKTIKKNATQTTARSRELLPGSVPLIQPDSQQN